MHKALNNVGARSESKAKFAGKVEHQMAMDEISASGKCGVVQEESQAHIPWMGH